MIQKARSSAEFVSDSHCLSGRRRRQSFGFAELDSRVVEAQNLLVVPT